VNNTLKVFRDYRIVSVVIIVFSGFLSLRITDWFMNLPSPTNSQAGFASAVVLALVAIGKYWMETKAHTTIDDE